MYFSLPSAFSVNLFLSKFLTLKRCHLPRGQMFANYIFWSFHTRLFACQAQIWWIRILDYCWFGHVWFCQVLSTLPPGVCPFGTFGYWDSDKKRSWQGMTLCTASFVLVKFVYCCSVLNAEPLGNLYLKEPLWDPLVYSIHAQAAQMPLQQEANNHTAVVSILCGQAQWAKSASLICRHLNCFQGHTTGQIDVRTVTYGKATLQ